MPAGIAAKRQDLRREGLSAPGFPGGGSPKLSQNPLPPKPFHTPVRGRDDKKETKETIS